MKLTHQLVGFLMFLRIKMRIYIFLTLFGVVFFTFFVGKYVGRANCQAETVVAQSYMQAEITKKIGEVNEEVLGRGAGDIRRVLREKYTIAE